MSTLAEALANTLITNRETIRTTIVESCPIPMFVADYMGDWVHVSLNYQKLLAYTTAEFLGRAWLETLAPESRKKTQSTWEHLVRYRVGVRHFPVEHLQADGHIVSGFMDVGFVPVDGFVGWFVPMCDEPTECPVHQHLLKNVSSKRNATEMTFVGTNNGL